MQMACLALCILIFLFVVTELWERPPGRDYRGHQDSLTAYVRSTSIPSLTIYVADDMILSEPEDLLSPSSWAAYKPMPTQFSKNVTVQVVIIERAAPMDRDSKQLARFGPLRAGTENQLAAGSTHKHAERLPKNIR